MDLPLFLSLQLWYNHTEYMQFCLRRREDRQCRPRNVHGRTVHVGPGRKINTTGRKDGRVPNLVLPRPSRAVGRRLHRNSSVQQHAARGNAVVAAAVPWL